MNSIWPRLRLEAPPDLRLYNEIRLLIIKKI
jgi:hypothetical protein